MRCQYSVIICHNNDVGYGQAVTRVIVYKNNCCKTLKTGLDSTQFIIFTRLSRELFFLTRINRYSCIIFFTRENVYLKRFSLVSSFFVRVLLL